MFNRTEPLGNQLNETDVALRDLSSEELDDVNGGFIQLAAAFGVAVDVALVVGATAAVGYAIYKLAQK